MMMRHLASRRAGSVEQILYALAILTAGLVGSDCGFAASYQSRLPSEVRQSCKQLAHMNYMQYNSPAMAQAEYDQCLWPYIQQLMDQDMNQLRQQMEPSYGEEDAPQQQEQQRRFR